MTFPDGDEKPRCAQAKVRVTVLAVLGRRSDRAQPGPGGTPDLLVISTDKLEGVIGGQVGATTVLMDGGRYRHARRQNVLCIG
jgi:hypothetical protein